jgi:hypothetical protein
MNPLDFPYMILISSAALLFGAACLGAALRRRRRDDVDRDEFNLVLSGALTLLGLIIGFSFSMAVSRYDSRKALEEEEANAIGTEYLRAELLPAAQARAVQSLLRDYLDERILFFSTSGPAELVAVNAVTGRLQNQLWASVRPEAQSKQTAINAAVVTGMNDVLNSQGYTQASFWNRIPPPAWLLMLVIAVASNLLVGYNGDPKKRQTRQFIILPIILAIAFYLIADMDSPRGGLVRVAPQNLLSLKDSLR